MIRRAIYTIPQLATCRIDYEGDKVIGLSLTSGFEGGATSERSDFSDGVFRQVMEYFAGERRVFDVAYDLGSLTPFQRRILEAVAQIPYGESRTYGQIAAMVGNPKAARAVGAACNRNPILIVIPCHRVVGARGAMVGYAAGVEIKRYLLDRERNSIRLE